MKRHRRWLYQTFALAWAARAAAHQPEVSRSDLVVDGQRVSVHVEAATAPLAGDGGPDAVLGGLVCRDTLVTLGGSSCSCRVDKAWIVDGDGAAVDAIFECPAAAVELSATMRWLSAMPAGHRHVAHLSVGSTALTALLSAEHPSASVRGVAPAPAVRPPPNLWPWIAAGAALVAIALLSLRAKKIRSRNGGR